MKFPNFKNLIFFIFYFFKICSRTRISHFWNTVFPLGVFKSLNFFNVNATTSQLGQGQQLLDTNIAPQIQEEPCASQFFNRGQFFVVEIKLLINIKHCNFHSFSHLIKRCKRLFHRVLQSSKRFFSLPTVSMSWGCRFTSLRTGDFRNSFTVFLNFKIISLSSGTNFDNLSSVDSSSKSKSSFSSSSLLSSPDLLSWLLHRTSETTKWMANKKYKWFSITTKLQSFCVHAPHNSN